MPPDLKRPARLLAAALLAAAAGCAGPRESGHPPSAPSPSVTSTTSPTTPPGSPSTRVSAPPSRSPAWTTYQGSTERLGVAPGRPPSTPLVRVWSDSLDGAAVYGQPLFYGGLVVVATEDDDVFALDARTGAIVWRSELGTPLRDVAAAAGCGDIDPLGVTSTPVVDPATGTVYVVAEQSSGGTPPVRHQLFGLDLRSGRVTLSVTVDPPLTGGQEPVHLLQRAALALGNSRIYIGYGGQYGDCGSYHGWVVAAPLPSGRPLESFDVTPSSSGGAVWDGGSGPSISAAGDVYVTTGNPNSGGPAPWSEAVLELRPDLSSPPIGSFQDRAATDDLDLATGGAVLLPDGDVFAAGKTDTGFVLSRSGLPLVARIKGTVCGSDPDGGAAFDEALGTLYLPCRGGGIQEIRLAARATGWRAGPVNSTPVLAGGELWALRYPQGTIASLDPATGRTLYASSVGRGVPNFASPAIADGMLLVPTDAGVVAFR